MVLILPRARAYERAICLRDGFRITAPDSRRNAARSPAPAMPIAMDGTGADGGMPSISLQIGRPAQRWSSS